MKREIGFFVIAGGVGFAIDAGGLYILNEIFDWHPIVARIPSFLAAVFATFAINRHLTFQAQDLCLKKSFLKYLSAVGVSQGTNFAIYSSLLYIHQIFFENPVLALCIGSGISMFLTFGLSKFWVFKKGKK